MLCKLFFSISQEAKRLDCFLTKHRFGFSVLLATALSGVLAVYNVSSGPLHNLNDIGGWSNRALFIMMSAAVHGALLMGGAFLSNVCFSRTALRQVILTAGYFILLIAINQKTYWYVQVLQPLVRAMDAGFSVGMQAESHFSAPAKILIYLITRGPVYDMYLLKLVAIGCYLATVLLVVYAAEQHHLGIRAEVLLALCVILPQAFMNVACSAMAVEMVALLLFAISLKLHSNDKKSMIAAMICFGTACALYGACLLALPVTINRKNWKCQSIVSVGVMIALCIPAVLGGMAVSDAVSSLFGAVLGVPVYAGGAPGVANLIPRAVVEEIPQYAAILRHLPQLDLVTNNQVHYTRVHFEIVMHGFAWAGFAAYVGLYAMVRYRWEKTVLHSMLTLLLGALIVSQGVTSGAWLALDLICLYALLYAPKLRLPSCLILFSTAAGSCYPMTEEVLLPMVYAFVLCMAALCMLLDVIPMGKEDGINE